MAWCRPGDNPSFEPMMVTLPTHICVQNCAKLWPDRIITIQTRSKAFVSMISTYCINVLYVVSYFIAPCSNDTRQYIVQSTQYLAVTILQRIYERHFIARYEVPFTSSNPNRSFYPCICCTMCNIMLKSTAYRESVVSSFKVNVRLFLKLGLHRMTSGRIIHQRCGTASSMHCIHCSDVQTQTDNYYLAARGLRRLFLGKFCG